MKNILLVLMVMMSLKSNAWRSEEKAESIELSEAQFNSYVTNTSDGLEVDISAICAEVGKCYKFFNISYEDLFSITLKIIARLL